MKIILPGGSGQVGTFLAAAWHAAGHEVVVLSRRPAATPWRTVLWDGVALGDWVREVDGADVVANLTGKSVNCRYYPANRREILESRVESTRVLGKAIGAARRPPKVWLQSSTATIYAHRYDAANDERSGILGGDEADLPDTWRFSLDVARAWEAECLEAATPHTRKVLMRTAMVMGTGRGGVFDVLLGLVRRRLGGRIGDGRQYMSWIHERDLVRALDWVIERDEFVGPVNFAAPTPLPQAEFMHALRRAWGAGWGIPASRPLLEIGCWVIRSESELVLKSRRVLPGLLLESGFRFDYPDWPGAASELCARWRATAGSGVRLISGKGA